MELVLERIDFLRQAGLTSVMVVAYYLCRCLVPLQERARPCWVYTGSQDITRTQIGAEWDLEKAALRGLLRVVIRVDDLGRAELPWKELAFYTDPNRVVLQVKLPEFDAQGLVNRPGRRNPDTIQIPWADEETGEEAAGSLRRQVAWAPRAAGRRLAVGLLQIAAAWPEEEAPPAPGRR